MITIAMPVWNSREITWLAMESFCRQETDLPWELIIYEEKHPQACGTDYFRSYIKRLDKAGCIKFDYITNNVKMSLSEKWAALGRRADKRSKMFCICATDNYYQKYMIKDTYVAYIEGCDFLTDKYGYAYDFNKKLLVVYNKPDGHSGLQMSYATEYMRKLPKIKKHKLLDGWIYDSCKPRKIKIAREHLTTLITHGYNNISGARGKMIQKFKHPFYETDKKLENIVPLDIVKQMESI